MPGESESHYHELFENSPVSLWEEDFSKVSAYFAELRSKGITDFQAYFEEDLDEVLRCAGLVEIVRVNRATLNLQGVDDASVLLGNLREILVEDAYDLFRDELIALATGETRFKQTVELSTVTGDSRHILLNLSVPEESRETLDRVLISMMDITEGTRARKAFERERKAFQLIAEAALEESYTEASSRRIISGLIDILEFDLGTIRLYDEGEQLLRLHALEGLPGGARNEIPIDEEDVLSAHVARTKAPIFQSDISEDPLLQAQKTTIEGLGIKSLIFWPILGPSDELLGVLNIAAKKKKHLTDQDRDLFQTITGMLATILMKNRAQEALQSSDERLRLIGENIKDIIFTMDMNFRFTYASPSSKQMLGYEPQELVQQPADNVLSPESIRIAEEAIAESLRLEEEVGKNGYKAPPLELELIRKDGEKIWAEVARTYLRDDDDTPIGVLGVARDITERKITERRLEEAVATAAFYNDLMAHDISNLQQGIMSSMELMLESGDLNEHLEILVKSALAQTERGATLVSNVKKLASLGEEARLVAMDLFDPVSEAVEMVKASYPSLKLEIITDVVEGQYVVLADEFLVDVFFNLFHNSARMDDSELVKIDVKAEHTEGEKYLTVKIQDRGPGINDSLKKAILARFGDREKRGSGLGLTLVRRIVTRYGGRIWVEDRVEGDHRQGTSMVMVIPLAARS